jgi:hypothetical protein
MTTDGAGQNNQSMAAVPWERLLDTSNQGVLEVLEENVTWWGRAALSCAEAAARLPSGEKERKLEWLLLGAVYRQRADMHARLIEQLRRTGDGAHGQIGRRPMRVIASSPGAPAA